MASRPYFKKFREALTRRETVKVTVSDTSHGLTVENGKLYVNGCDCSEEASLEEAREMRDLLDAYIASRRK
ncbi:hypothetical protein [Streptomyces sp. NPDC001787]|uniref:hypothetical protein n=1 Tax=Streptomyces sp. NPDC001787 TaxID=3154523 RepID=UPI00332FD237